MKKTTIIFMVIMTLAMSVSGKVRRNILAIAQTTVPETETIIPETMEFVYDYTWCNDTVGHFEDNKTSDQMLLQIASNGITKFSSYRNLTVDSLLMKMSEDQVDNAYLEGKLANGDFMTIFKNYPEGKLTQTDKVCMDWFRYEEDIPEIEWELTDSVTNVLGYECQAAVCNFRGRTWTVFYTEEIPIMEGPWKLHGLPGLIMKAYDKNQEYVFECVGIKSNASRPITIYKVPYNNTSRLKYYEAKHQFDINPFGFYEAVTGEHVDVVDETGTPIDDSNEPVELLYDYIERDWRKQ